MSSKKSSKSSSSSSVSSSVRSSSLASPKPSNVPTDPLDSLKSPLLIAASSALAASRKSASSSKSKSVALSHSGVHEDFVSSGAAFTAAQQAVTNIIDRGFQLIHSHFITREAMDMAARDAVHSVLQAVEWTLIQHDQGENTQVQTETETETDELYMAQPSMRNELWASEAEPAPIDLDRWARGAIGVRPSVQSLERLNEDQPINVNLSSLSLADKSRSLSASSRLSSRSARSRQSSGTQRSARKEDKEKDKNEEIKESNAIKKPIPLDDAPSIDIINAEKERARELRKLFAARKAQQEKEAAAAAEAAEAAKFAAIAAELKGKNYTFDSQNNVIVVEPPRVDSFPAFALQPRVEVRDAEEDNEDLSANTRENRIKRRKRAELMAKRAQEAKEAGIVLIDPEEKAAQAQRIAEAAAVKSPGGRTQRGKEKAAPKKKVDNGFIDLSLLQPSLINSMNLVPGATVRQGSQTKTPDPRLGVAPGAVDVSQINAALSGSSAFDSLDRSLLVKLTKTQFNQFVDRVREQGNTFRIQSQQAEEAEKEKEKERELEKAKEKERQKEMEREREREKERMFGSQDEQQTTQNQSQLQAAFRPSQAASLSASSFNHTSNSLSSTGPMNPPVALAASRSAALGRSRGPRDRPAVPSHLLTQRIPEPPKHPLDASQRPKPFQKLAQPSRVVVSDKAKFFFATQTEETAS